MKYKSIVALIFMSVFPMAIFAIPSICPPSITCTGPNTEDCQIQMAPDSGIKWDIHGMPGGKADVKPVYNFKEARIKGQWTVFCVYETKLEGVAKAMSLGSQTKGAYATGSNWTDTGENLENYVCTESSSKCLFSVKPK